jgi:hypothetical protein
MLGYSYTAMKSDSKVFRELQSIPYGLWTDEHKALNQSLILAKWSTAGYSPRWPEQISDRSAVVVVKEDILKSVFHLPLWLLAEHLNHDMKHEGPVVFGETGVTERGDLIRPIVNRDLFLRCDVNEIIEVSRWDMS